MPSDPRCRLVLVWTLFALLIGETVGVVCFRQATFGAVDTCESKHYCAARLMTDGCQFSSVDDISPEGAWYFNTTARMYADYGCDLFGASYRCAYETNETGSCWNVTDGKVTEPLITSLLTLFLSDHSTSLLLLGSCPLQRTVQ